MYEKLSLHFKTTLHHLDWLLIGAILPLVGAGLITMYSFQGGESIFYDRQILWASLSFIVLFVVSFFDLRFLKRTGVLVVLFFFIAGLLTFLVLFGAKVKGAQSWFDLGAFSVQPTDPAKLVLILILAKYFSRRHIEIAHVRHILVSGAYALIIFLLVFFQPDFGSSIIIFLIWLGMVLVSGISNKHLAFVVGALVLSSLGLWFYGFEEYQRQRIASFISPLTDIQGVGYNAYQATIAVGSGQLLGKGIGGGTQSRLQFLPEYETDFIFAAYAEEWGFIGVTLFIGLFGIVIWRIIAVALESASNFETLFAAGLAVMLMSHFVIHVGMNLGLMPITGTPLPFVSYGGSHLVTEFLGLGILLSMRRYAGSARNQALAT